MNHGRTKKSLLIALALASFIICPIGVDAKSSDDMKYNSLMDVPVYTASSYAQGEQNKIDDESGRLLVSPKTLEQYGIYSVSKKKDTYVVRLPAPVQGTALWRDDSVSLTFPHEKTGGKDNKVDITSIRRPLGIGYSIDGVQKSVVPPTTLALSAPQLKGLQMEQEQKKEGTLGDRKSVV